MSTNEDHLPTLLAGPAKGPSSRHLTCIRCQRRKVKCDRKEPCSNCVKVGVSCISTSSLPPRHRKKRFSEAELLARLTRYEELLRGYGADLDAIKYDGGSIPPHASKDANYHLKISHRVGAAPNSASREAISMQDNSNGGSFLGDSNTLIGLKNEFRDTEELLGGSSEDELIEAPITTTWKTMENSNAGVLLFGSQDKQIELTVLHPHPMDIMRLWQMFLDNVNPLTKAIHAPSLQQQIIEASTNLGSISKSMEALLFSIYSLSIMSIDEIRCKAIFGEDKSVLLDRYQFGAQQALLNAEFLRPSSLMVLQALLLYLISIRMGVDPRSVFCLSGVTVRLAQQMGLHRDDQDPQLSPFEVEMRRRIWWQIVLFDCRVAEFSGVGTSSIHHQWTTRLPLNVNDSDLYPHMRDAPIEHIGITEMIFCLTRCEVADFLRRVRTSTVFDGCWYELSTSHIRLSAKDNAIDELEQLLESKYLRHCDESIPLHFISVSMTKYALCKLRHIAHHPRLLPDRGVNRPQDEKGRFFSWSLEMIEHSNVLSVDKSVQRFAWYISLNKPMDGCIHVLNELRHRTTGKLVERAWQQILECFDNRVFLGRFGDSQNPSAIFLALSNLLLKAWEARANALKQSQPLLSTPDLILQLQNKLSSWRSSRFEPTISELPLEESQDQQSNAFSKNYPNLPESNDSIDLSMQFDSASAENPLDWVYWKELTLDYPRFGMGDGGGNGFSIA